MFTGQCHYCGTHNTVHEVSGEEEVGIAEDAQSLADYYLMDEHTNPQTGEDCHGSNTTPEYLNDPDEDWGDEEEEDGD